MVAARVGSAVVKSQRVFQVNYPNAGEHAREMLALSYRPAWAGPSAAAKDWKREQVALLAAAIQLLFGDRNTRHWTSEGGNKSANRAGESPAIDPGRWERI